MDESNHDMIHTITQQISNMFRLLIENMNMSYQQLHHQMGKVVGFFGVPPTPVPKIPQGVNPQKNRVVENRKDPEGLKMVLVQHNQDVDQVLRQAQQDNVGYKIISLTPLNAFWSKMTST